MHSCLVCPTWTPCKCAGGPTLSESAPISVAAWTAIKPKAKINVRQKGHNGERSVVILLNEIIGKVITANPDWNPADVDVAKKCIQRNQNQSAVGGGDLNGVFGLGIEIKRHENIQIEPWWRQTVAGAARNAEHPVLLYRANHQPWRCVTIGHAPLPGGRLSSLRVQFEEEAFKIWFYQWVYYKMMAGDLPGI